MAERRGAYLVPSGQGSVDSVMKVRRAVAELPHRQDDRSLDVGLDVVLVNWNSGSYLRKCIESLLPARVEAEMPMRIIVVDNASTDASLDSITKLDLPITIIPNGENRGFAAACNQGAMAGDFTYILFLNPDVQVLEDSVRVPLGFMQHVESSKYGICGVQLVDETANIYQSCARFPTWPHIVAKTVGLDQLFPQRFPAHFLSEDYHHTSREVDQVSGAFFLVRRRLFEDLSGFDERFFVYFEELDFSLRARQAGFASFYLARARALHYGARSSAQVPATRLFYFWRSRICYCYKHFPCVGASVVLLTTLLIEPIVRVGAALKRRSGREALAPILGAARLWAGLPSILGVCQRK